MFEEPMLFAESANDEISLHTLETRNAELERANFDLKMKVFYLSNSSSSSNRSSTAGSTDESDDTFADMLREKDAMLLTLKDANDSAKRRILDLENEVLMSKMTAEAHTSSLSSEKLQQQQEQLQHNLRSERQAALAIAEHDSKIITDLENELEKIATESKKKRDEDKKIISELVDKVSVLFKTLEIKENDLREARDLCASKDNMIEALTIRLTENEKSPAELEPEILLKSESGRTEHNTHNSAHKLPKKLSLSVFVNDTAKKQFYSPLGSTNSKDDDSPDTFMKEWGDLGNLRY